MLLLNLTFDIWEFAESNACIPVVVWPDHLILVVGLDLVHL